MVQVWRAESYTIDESADEDFYNPVTDALFIVTNKLV